MAETQHLPSAASELGVVPSSLSRMVKQLEDELGVSLFDRSTKNLVLNDAGRRFLIAVREAMRVVDDALVAAVGDELRGSTGAVATGELAQLIMIPASAMLSTSHPGLVMTTICAGPEEAIAMLLRGDADASVLDVPSPIHADLRSTELATLSRAVFARSGEPRLPRRCVMVGTAVAHDDDGWPANHERDIAAWAPDQRAALEMCARGDLVTVAYDAAVRAYGFAERVVRLAEPTVTPRTLYLVHRREVGRHHRTEVLLEAIRHAVVELTRVAR